MRSLLFFVILAVSNCSHPLPPISHGMDEYGRHPLPFRPNERFVLVSITAEPGHWPDRFIEIGYLLDGHRRRFVLSGAGTTDGYVTDSGRIISSENPKSEGPIMEERVILLASEEQITVVGNTVSEGEVRLRNRKEG